MSFGRLLLVLLVLAGGFWLVRTQHLIGPAADAAGDGTTAAPTDRARAAVRASARREAQTEAAKQSLDSEPAGTVSENMTPEQVRALLGPPDSMDSETSDSGVSREKWTYRSVGKTVVFENGIVARIE
jgi:hypothetical protein